jgi:hypothetical protein
LPSLAAHKLRLAADSNSSRTANEATPAQKEEFAKAWNSIVDDLRTRDLLSDNEQKYLKYEVVLLPAMQEDQGSASAAGSAVVGEAGLEKQQLLLLPQLIAAGKVMDAKERHSETLVQREVVQAAWGCLVWLLRAMKLEQSHITGADAASQVDVEGYGADGGLAKRGELLVKHLGLLMRIKAELKGQKVMGSDQGSAGSIVRGFHGFNEHQCVVKLSPLAPPCKTSLAGGAMDMQLTWVRQMLRHCRKSVPCAAWVMNRYFVLLCYIVNP